MKKYIISKLKQYSINKTLNEASFFDIDMKDIIDDKYVNSIINDGTAHILLNHYMDENDLTDKDENEVLDSPEFFDFLKSELEKNFEDAMLNIGDLINYDTNKIKIHRVITVDDNWLEHLQKQGKRLGIYWSWDKDYAEAHWADTNKKNTALIESEIDEKYVDWERTLKMNAHFSFSEEREISLFKNTPLKITNLTINDEEIDTSIFKNKTFYA